MLLLALCGSGAAYAQSVGSAAGASTAVIDRDGIVASGAQSVQEVLRQVPMVTGFGNAAQGSYGSGDGSGTFAPTLHGLGAGASNATLVLVDGRRIPATGVNHSLIDPDVIAPMAIERIELLPDGASALFGPDAAAGVINIVTRRGFQGSDARARSGIANNYHNYDAGFLWGKHTDHAGLLLNYNFEFRDDLSASHRSFSRANHSLIDPEAGVEGGGAGDFANNNCSPASVNVGAGAVVYPYTGAPVANANCDFISRTDLVPETYRHNLLIQGHRNLSERLILSSDLVFSRQEIVSLINRGSVTNVRVWGAGSTGVTAAKINPFFAGPVGATDETVSWQADDLLGLGASDRGLATAVFGAVGATYRLAGDWRVYVAGTLGRNDSSLRREGVICTSCTIMALNGTVTTGGAGNLRQTLTPANALDVWTPLEDNRTSATTRAQLIDSARVQSSKQTMQAFTARLEGALGELSAGSLHLALGADYLGTTMDESLQAPRNAAPAGTNALNYSGEFSRIIRSVQAQLSVPLVGEVNAIRGVRRLQLDLASRYDRLSDAGAKTSPRIGFEWGLTTGFTLRGNAARSFVAPALASRGDANGVNSESGITTLSTNSQTSGTMRIPVSFPGIAQLQALNLPGCAAGATTCLLGNNSVTGLQRAGGNEDLRAPTVETRALGFDLKFQRWPGFRLSATYWNACYRGGIVSPSAAFIAASPQLSAEALTIYPAGASAAEIAAVTAGMPQVQTLPAKVYFTLSTQLRNALYLDAAGIDGNASYTFDTRRGVFSIDLQASRKIKLDQRFGDDGVTFSTLNTVGVNSDFPSNRLGGRLDLGWKRGAWNTQLRINYEGFYRNWGASAASGIPSWSVVRAANLYPLSGGEPIESYTTIDLHGQYDFGVAGIGGAWSRNLKLTLDAYNLFDNRPPFFNVPVGYDIANASPIDRRLTLGLMRNW